VSLIERISAWFGSQRRPPSLDRDRCIQLLLDKQQPYPERDAAAESLAFAPSAQSVDALLIVAHDSKEPVALRETAAQSLGAIWAEIGVDSERLESLPEALQFEVRASIPGGSPRR
jgi:hypothetical protein